MVGWPCMEGGHVWLGGGACIARAMHGRGMCGRGCVWPGGPHGRGCMAREMATAADGTHPTGMHSC